MGRILERNDSFVQGSYQRCIGGLLNILDYHQWHVKRLLPHKRHHARRRGRLNRSPKISSHFREELVDVDAELLLAKQHFTEAKNRTTKKSRKARSKYSSAEHHGSWILSSYLNSWLHRTSPIHHLRPSESWDYTDANEEIPVLISHKSSVIHARNKSENGLTAMRKDGSDQQLGQSVDVLEIFKANKEIFLKILQDPEACKKHFHGLKNSNLKVRLAKSRSFPVASSKQASYIGPSTLKHKQNEIWFFTESEDSVADTDSIRADDGRKDMAKPPSQGWNQVVTRRFREIKHKIKQALKESKREKNGHKSVEECAENGTEIYDRREITIDRERNDLQNRRIERVSRTSSLNESLDRYTQLFENTFGGEARKFSHSRSLRVSTTSEEKLPPRKSCRRNLSLSDLDSLSSFLNNTDNKITEPESIFGRSETFAGMEYSNLCTVEIAEDSNEEEIVLPKNPCQESDSESCSSDGICNPAVFPLPEAGLESETHSTQPEKTNSSNENEDFNYVRHVLELSSSIEHPLNPSIFKLVEESLERDDDDEITCYYSQLNRQILFDLVNETLVDLSEKSFAYFPRPNSRPNPIGSGLLEEVWRRADSYLCLRPELDTSLEDVVARDLARRDGWRNLEFEREMVALELEDLIFDQLLDEVLF